MPKTYNRKKLKDRVYGAMREEPLISLKQLALKLGTSWSVISDHYHDFRDEELQNYIKR